MLMNDTTQLTILTLPDAVDRFCEARALVEAAQKELDQAKAQLYEIADVAGHPIEQQILLTGRRFLLQFSAGQRERKYLPNALRSLHHKVGDSLLDLVTLSLATFDKLIPDSERGRYVETRIGTTRKATVTERR